LKDSKNVVADKIKLNGEIGRTKIHPNDYDKLIQMVVVEKMCVNQLCEEFKVSRACIENTCIKLNIKLNTRRNNSNFTLENTNIEEFKELVEAKFTIGELAKHYKCSESKISLFKKQLGLINQDFFTKEKEQEFIDVCNKNQLHRNEIMKMFNIKTIGTFYYLRKKLIP
jgi:hypothetical protein